MKFDQILSQTKDTDELIIGEGVIDKCSECFKTYWPQGTAMIVADENTWAAAGMTAEDLFGSAGIKTAPPLIFNAQPRLKADYANTRAIKERIGQNRKIIPVSVGSGTINDLVKRAAFELDRTYLCIGTAASMDGYCSSGAALTRNGRKQTMECPAPKAVIADTRILGTAPPEASAAGFGDLASKLTAGADWIIADFTGVDPIDINVWNIIQPNLDKWLDAPEALAAGKSEKLSDVFEGLNLSGLAMQILGRSRAASGAEHLLSHIWEMSGHCGADGNPVSHGFQVSVGICCVSALMTEVFSLNADDIDIETAVAAYPPWKRRTVEIEQLMENLPSWREYIEICRQKHLDQQQLRTRLIRIKAGWGELKSKVEAKLPDYDKLRRMLKTAGCPVSPEEINMSRKTAVSAFAKAQCMRNRYTILDLAYELGVFFNCIENIKNNNKYLN